VKIDDGLLAGGAEEEAIVAAEFIKTSIS